MDDETKTTPSGDGAKQPRDETFAWTETEPEASGSSGAQATAERMISQLQSMIDSLATQAAPVAKQIGAKAAELAAAAADRAGPLAQKAAEATVDASGKLAERSRGWAKELRRDANGGGASTAVLDAPDTTGDDPAEGPRT